MGSAVGRLSPAQRSGVYDPGEQQGRVPLNAKDAVRQRVEAVAERNAATRSSSAPKLSPEEFNSLKNKEKALEEIRMYAPTLVQATTGSLTVRWEMIYATGQAKIQLLDLQWKRIDDGSRSRDTVARASLEAASSNQVDVPCVVQQWTAIPNEVVDRERREVYLAGLEPSDTEPLQQFVFRIRARNSSGWSSWSGVSEAMWTQSSRLMAPRIEPTRPFVFRITWAHCKREDFYGQVLYYKLYIRRVSDTRSGASEAGSPFFLSPGFKEVFSGRDTEIVHGDKGAHKALEAGATYAFKLEVKTGLNARDKRYSSLYTSEPTSYMLPATVPYKPNTVWVDEEDDTQATKFKWSLHSDGGSPILYYKLYAAPMGIDANDESILVYQGPETTHTIIGQEEKAVFEAGTTYKLHVVATNALGDSAPSKSTRYKPQPQPEVTETSEEKVEETPTTHGEWRTINGSLLNILAPSPDSIVNLPAGWQEYWDPKNEECFYYNALTGETQWEMPEFDGEEVESPVQSPEEQAFLVFRKKRFRLLQSLREGQIKTEDLQISKLHIRRDQLFEDSVAQILHIPPEQLSYKVRIIYTAEDGIDSGGLSKDWYLECSRAFLAESAGLFERGSSQRHNVAGHAHVLPGDVRRYFHAFGRLLGKAIYEQQLVDAPLCTGLMKRVLRVEPSLDDLRELDSILANSLDWIQHNEIEGVIEETFSITVDEFGLKNTYELVPNGKEMDVTESNKEDYVRKVVQWKFGGLAENLVDAFAAGFYAVVPFELIESFEPDEVLLLLNGKDEINVGDIKNGCVRYEGGFNRDSPTVLLFWEAMEGFTNEQRQQVIRFVTGCDKVPLDGFSPFLPFTVTKSADLTVDALPVAHTCFNQLVLPSYETIQQITDKMLYACAHGTGFNLT